MADTATQNTPYGVGSDEPCPKAWDGGSHHLIPRREGQNASGPLFVQTCTHCGGTYRGGVMVPLQGKHRPPDVDMRRPR